MSQTDPTDLPTGISTGGKKINLAQLQSEMIAAGVPLADGLGMADELQIIFTYDANGTPVDFDPTDVPAIQSVIDAHVAMREETDEEYAAEFATAGNTRKTQINGILNGLAPRDQVPM